VFPKLGKVTVQRKEEFGGDVVYETYEQLEKEFVEGQLHPGDLKAALASCINEILQPVRDHFEQNDEAKKILAKVRKYKVTR